MTETDPNPSIRSISKLVLLPKHKTRSMTPYEAIEKNLGFSGGKNVFKDIDLLLHTKIIKTVVYCFNVASKQKI